MSDQEKSELLADIDAYCDDPNGTQTCDLLCGVADALGLDGSEYTPDELREIIENS